MKFSGGYQPKTPGRPVGDVRDAAVPERLYIELQHNGVTYAPAVRDGDRVEFGAPLGWAEAGGGRVALPAPAAGTVAIEADGDGHAAQIVLRVTSLEARPRAPQPPPERTTAAAMRQALAKAGIWPLIWSSRTGGMPALDGSERPNRILIKFVAAEPFRARGKVVLREGGEHVTTGLRYLPQLLDEYGVIHLMLTELGDPAAQALRRATAGYAWMRVESVPVRYPVEHPRVLWRALRRADKRVKQDETVWVLDVQAVQAVGACMGAGLPLYERIVAVGGPGAARPGHVRVRRGARLDAWLDAAALDAGQRVLRGGLLCGQPVDGTAAVRADDDAFFVMPRPGEREFLGFARPGFDRVSILPCCASVLTGGSDRQLTASLRGELRPCIACGLCEKVCPVDLLPQVLHRYLYRDAMDEAENAGLSLCIGCGLCAYVCPSKLELTHQFAEARQLLQAERAEAATAEAAHERRDETLRHEKEHSEDWRK